MRRDEPETVTLRLPHKVMEWFRGGWKIALENGEHGDISLEDWISLAITDWVEIERKEIKSLERAFVRLSSKSLEGIS